MQHVQPKGSYTWSKKSAPDSQIWIIREGFEPNLTQICGIRALFWLHVYEAYRLGSHNTLTFSSWLLREHNFIMKKRDFLQFWLCIWQLVSLLIEHKYFKKIGNNFHEYRLTQKGNLNPNPGYMINLALFWLHVSANVQDNLHITRLYKKKESVDYFQNFKKKNQKKFGAIALFIGDRVISTTRFHCLTCAMGAR